MLKTNLFQKSGESLWRKWLLLSLICIRYNYCFIDFPSLFSLIQILQVLYLRLGRPEVFLGKCLQPPSMEQMTSSVANLIESKAVLPLKELPITALGYHLAKMPLDVKLGKVRSSIHIIYAIHTYIHFHSLKYTYIHTYTCYLSNCSQFIKLSNPNRISTLTDLHSLKYTYIHKYIHIHIFAFRC